MRYLEDLNARDKVGEPDMLKRLRQIPPETGRFIALLASNAPPGMFIEIGTSAGYSAIWLALACELTNRTLTTFEVLPAKAALAKETFNVTHLDAVVHLVEGDARKHLPQYENLAFCFLDAEKDVYLDCYEMVVPKLVQGGLLVADNAISHRAELEQVLDRALHDPRVDAMVVPVGQGVLVCRKI
jgi:predicted O-methyltransferase YrrM